MQTIRRAERPVSLRMYKLEQKLHLSLFKVQCSCVAVDEAVKAGDNVRKKLMFEKMLEGMKEAVTNAAAILANWED